MIEINRNFAKLPGSYLFSETAKKAELWQKANEDKRLIRMGIGDVTLPIPDVAAQAMVQASREMGEAKTFRGYGPEQGYAFLREAICQTEYAAREIEISPDEIFVSDGIKSECGSILELFGRESIIGLCDPVYPAYIDAAIITGYAGRLDPENGSWSNLRYLPCLAVNGFVPAVPDERLDLVYLCFPNNPTGAMATAEQLQKWVCWANDTSAILLFDGAYEAFIKDESLPHSIYEIKGAETCAIELRSFSKQAGFTGLRCGYTVIPKALKRGGAQLHQLWKRRQSGRMNGVSYIVQRGAQAIFTSEGQQQVQRHVAYYQENAKLITGALREAGYAVLGGENSPYVWVKTLDGMSSWDFFDRLLNKCGVLTTPGRGFGSCGEGYIRFTAFGTRDDVEEAMERIRKLHR